MKAETLDSAAASGAAASSPQDRSNQQPCRIILRHTPNNGNTLFNAIGFLFLGRSGYHGVLLRELLCSQALDHPEMQEEPQRSHIEEYASLLMDEKYEGGDAELEWFAHHYQTEIILIDVSVDPPEILKYGKLRCCSHLINSR